MTESALRAYLLGKLTESEVELVETRLLEDADLFSQMETAEDDLFDAFARNRLDADERARFIERFGADHARRQFAKALVHRTSAGRVLPFVQRRWVELAVAATLAIVVGGLVIPRAPVSEQPSSSPAATPVTTVSPAPTTSRVSLTLGTSRAAGAPGKVTIDPLATQVDIRIRLNPADRYASYAADVRAQSDLIIWGDATLKPTTEDGELVVHAMVPADRLPAGTYEIAVRGGANATALDDLGFVTIEVSRPN